MTKQHKNENIILTIKFIIIFIVFFLFLTLSKNYNTLKTTNVDLLYIHLFVYKTFKFYQFSLNEVIWATITAIILTLITLTINKSYKIILILIFTFILTALNAINAFNYIPINKNLKKDLETPYKLEKNTKRTNKNVIIIYLESIEKGFFNYEDTNLMPYLEKLSKENITFNGYEKSFATGHTSGSLYSMLYSSPINRKLDKEPHVNSFINLFDDHNSLYLSGDPNKFMAVNKILKYSAFDKIINFEEIIELCKKDKRYCSTQSLDTLIHDIDLYRIAKMEISKLSQKKEPFFVRMSTLDTHFPKGYSHPSCKKEYNDIRDAIICSDNDFKDFFEWLKKQSFYKNTLIVIVGDHLQMPTTMRKNLEKHKREIINIFINSKFDKNKINTNRNFSQYDITPTIVEASGINLIKNQIGFGVSLFSETPTLIEKHGLENFNNFLRINSLF